MIFGNEQLEMYTGPFPMSLPRPYVEEFATGARN
jgi:hypothetical protein